MASSKIIKCELIDEANSKLTVPNKIELTINYIKPGYMVQTKVTSLVDNGINVSFLSGFSGTIFADHLDRDSV